MEPADYCARIGVSVPDSSVREGLTTLWKALDDAKMLSLPATPHALNRLYVRELAPGQTYDLSPVLGGRNTRATMRLITLQSVIGGLVDATRLDSLALAQLRTTPRGTSLVRLMVHGPTEEGETTLQNTTHPSVRAVLSGRGAVEQAGAKGASAVLPVLSEKGEVLGVVEASHSVANSLNVDRLACLVALALEAPSLNCDDGVSRPVA